MTRVVEEVAVVGEEGGGFEGTVVRVGVGVGSRRESMVDVDEGWS